MLPHVRFQIPPAEHSALSAFPVSPASSSFCGVISMIKPGRCCMTSSSGPRSAMPQRMNFNEIAHNLLRYTMFCASKTKSKMGSVESEAIMFFHFEVANMPNIPTHSPEIPLRRKFRCLSAAVDLSSSASAMTVTSFSSQFSICTSLAPLRSSAIASSFLSGWHSRRSL